MTKEFFPSESRLAIARELARGRRTPEARSTKPVMGVDRTEYGLPWREFFNNRMRDYGGQAAYEVPVLGEVLSAKDAANSVLASDYVGAGVSAMAANPFWPIPRQSIEARKLAADIARIMRRGEYDNYGLRVTEDPLTVGETAPHSWSWRDGNWTDEPLDGASAMSLDLARRDGVQSIPWALENAGYRLRDGFHPYYPGEHVSLIGGNVFSAGEDVGEIILSDGVVLSSWRKPFGGGRE